LTGWGGVPSEPCAVTRVADRRAAAALAGEPLIGRGLGRAYGD
jgi:hypothetical protein